MTTSLGSSPNGLQLAGTVRCSKLTAESRAANSRLQDRSMIKFLLFLILLVLCWPLALLALILYPIVWLLMLPFRILGFAVGGVLELVKAILFLPARLLGSRA